MIRSIPATPPRSSINGLVRDFAYNIRSNRLTFSTGTLTTRTPNGIMVRPAQVASSSGQSQTVPRWL